MPGPEKVEEIWIDEGEVREDASRAVSRGRGDGKVRKRGSRGGSKGGSGRGSPVGRDDGQVGDGIDAGSERLPVAARNQDPATALVKAVGEARGKRLERRLRQAADAYEDGHYDEALKLVRQVTSEAPSVAAARELHGLTLYRLGRWKAAIKELEAFRQMTGSVEQHPVLADCYRALRRYSEVDDLWLELREVSPAAELVTEGRIVVAGSQADRGDLTGALRTLQQGWKVPKRPRPHHLRRAYALADLYERAGELPRARELFGWVALNEPEFGDVGRRLENLG